MKAVILAAGMGNRLGRHTENLPKTLLQVGGKPLLLHIVECIYSNGFKKLVIVTGFQQDKIKKAVEEFSLPDLDVIYAHNPDYDSTNNIYSLRLSEEAVLPDGFLILNSDVYFHPSILQRLIEYKKEGIILSVDVEKKLGKEEMKVSIKEDKIESIGKDLPPHKSDGEYIGIARVDKNFAHIFYEVLSEVIADEGKGVFYEEVFKRLIDMGYEVNYTTTGGLPWIEIDTPRDLKTAEADIAPDIEGHIS
jgi:choline kinase